MNTKKNIWIAALLMAAATVTRGHMPCNPDAWNPHANEHAVNRIDKSVDGEALILENWMTKPFATHVERDPLTLEEWMSTPFSAEFGDQDVALEDWMIQPFEVNLCSDKQGLEEWMYTPFLVEEPLRFEEWMTVDLRKQ